MAAATVPWNASPCLCQGHASHSCSSHCLSASGMRTQAPYGKHRALLMGSFGRGLPKHSCSTRCYHAALFSSSLSFYPISDLQRSPAAFSVFPIFLAIFLRGLSANKSPTHLILLLSTSWGPGVTHWSQFPYCFPFYSSSPYAFAIEMPPNALLLNLALGRFPLSHPAFSCLHQRVGGIPPM